MQHGKADHQEFQREKTTPSRPDPWTEFLRRLPVTVSLAGAVSAPSLEEGAPTEHPSEPPAIPGGLPGTAPSRG